MGGHSVGILIILSRIQDHVVGKCIPKYKRALFKGLKIILNKQTLGPNEATKRFPGISDI